MNYSTYKSTSASPWCCHWCSWCSLFSTCLYTRTQLKSFDGLRRRVPAVRLLQPQKSQLGPEGSPGICVVVFQLDLGEQGRPPRLHDGDACAALGGAACWLEPAALSQHNSSQGHCFSHHPAWSGNTSTSCSLPSSFAWPQATLHMWKGERNSGHIYTAYVIICLLTSPPWCCTLVWCHREPTCLPHWSILVSSWSGRGFISVLQRSQQTDRCKR